MPIRIIKNPDGTQKIGLNHFEEPYTINATESPVLSFVKTIVSQELLGTEEISNFTQTLEKAAAELASIMTTASENNTRIVGSIPNPKRQKNKHVNFLEVNEPLESSEKTLFGVLTDPSIEISIHGKRVYFDTNYAGYRVATFIDTILPINLPTLAGKKREELIMPSSSQNFTFTLPLLSAVVFLEAIWLLKYPTEM